MGVYRLVVRPKRTRVPSLQELVSGVRVEWRRESNPPRALELDRLNGAHERALLAGDYHHAVAMVFGKVR